MFQYEHEKRSPSRSGAAEWARPERSPSRSGAAERARPERSPSRSGAAGWVRPGRVQASAERARRPLPPRPVCARLPSKPTVPLRIWVVAGASCLAVSAALVLATLAVTKWTTTEYNTELYEPPAPIYSKRQQPTEESDEIDNMANLAILEKLSLFKTMVANREKNKDLLTKPQIHPLHEPISHPNRNIEKKDKPKPEPTAKPFKAPHEARNQFLPEFKPLLPMAKDLKLPESYLNNINKDYEDYYNDDNLYDDYMESNTMTSYLIEKVQELHDWITKDPDFESTSNTTNVNTKTEFGQLLRALNDSLLEGNVSIVMHKLKDIYFGDNYTSGNNSRRVILTNGTDLVSFGILTLDIMLLHNIQVMAWENQDGVRSKMMKDPDVFAFNALFMDPSKVEAKQGELAYNASPGRVRDAPGSLFERALEGAMSAARAALHLGRAYRNARNILSQLATRGAAPPGLPRRLDTARALQHLQTFTDSDNQHLSPSEHQPDSGSDSLVPAYTELDCVWLLYCRNLAATARLAPPYGAMARINGMGLRMVAGALSAERALDALVYEALTGGWTPLDCDHMLPKCSKADAAAVVLQAILQPQKKTSNRGR